MLPLLQGRVLIMMPASQAPAAARCRQRRQPGQRQSPWDRLLVVPIWVVLLLGLFLLPTATAQGQAQGQGQQTTTGSFNARVLGKTEGCFNTFQALLVVDFPTNEVLSNAACQALCGRHGFVTAATSRRECHCGNIYPPIFHRVDDKRCSLPCSLDRTTCSLSACCGDAAGKYYTVSFAGEIEPRRELLRRLAFDYRESAPLFRQRIEGLMAQTTALQVLRSGAVGASSMASDGGAAVGVNNDTAAAAATTTFVGLGEGCPTGWQAGGDSCYMATVGGNPVNYEEAQTLCAASGGALASLTSANHNAMAKKLLHGQTGWLGLVGAPHPAGPTWRWDGFAAWDGDQPDPAAFARRSPEAYGPVSGGEFDDYTRDVLGLASLTVGYALGSIVSIQATYRLKSGKTLTTPVRGGEARTFETLTLGAGERVTLVEGVANSNALQGLTFTVTNAARQVRTWGPVGSSSKPTFSYRPASEVVALYGRYGAKALYRLGFYEYVGKACGQVNDQGRWEAVYCAEKAAAPSYLCERPQERSRRDCPAGWMNFGLSCIQAVAATATMSWDDAAAACRAAGGWLARVDSKAKQDAAWALLQGARGFIGLRDFIASSEDSLWGWDHYENWAPGSGQPLPVLDAEGRVDPPAACAVMDAGTGQWRTVRCSESLPAAAPVCEAPALDDQCACPAGWVNLGCTCYLLSAGSSQSAATPPGPGASWVDMQAFCAAAATGGTLPLPRNAAANAAVAKAAAAAAGAGAVVCLGLRDIFGQGALVPEVFTAWGGGSAPSAAAGLCGVMRSDGQWYGQDCLTRLRAFVCRLPRAATAAYVGGEDQGFAISLLPGQQIAWGRPLHVEITQADTGYHLAVDRDGHVFPLVPSSAATQGPNPNVSTTFSLAMASHDGGQGVDAFILRSKDLGTYIYSDPSSGQLRAVPAPSAAGSMAPVDLVKGGYASLFSAQQVVPAIGIQNLAISFVAEGNADAGPVLCSMFVYDLTPESNSYRCFEVQGDPTGLPIVSLQMAAWTNQDKASVLTPRVPLDLGRFVCENSSPMQSSTCTATYGQALSMAAFLNILNGYQLQDTYQVSYGNPDGNFWNLAILRSNTYTDITQVQYLQTNQYTAIVPVPPATTTTLQFWQSTVNLNYMWSALFNAVGSFQLSSLGFNLDAPRSLTTVSSTQDLLFYLWGRMTYPTQGEITISNNMAPFQSYPFAPPEMNNT